MRILFTLFIGLLLHTNSAVAQFAQKKTLIDYSFKAMPSTMAVSDLNKDGRPDMVVTHDSYTATASYFIQNANGSFTETLLSESQKHGSIRFIETIDLDGNGYNDIVALTENHYTGSTNKILVWYNYGGVMSGYPQVLLQNLGTNGFKNRLYLNDIDLDGRVDIVLSQMHSSSKVVWLKNTGPYGSWPLTILQNINATDDIVVADLNGDGRPEIVADSYIYSGAGFTTKKAVSVDNVYMATADIDRDGDLDIIAGPYIYDDYLAWFENKGNFEFIKHIIPNSAGSFSAIHIMDFEQDGLPDIVAGCGTSCKITLFRNTGKGEFTSSFLSYATPGLEMHESLRSADMDQDGKMDLLMTEYAWRTVGMYRNEFPAFEGVLADFRASATPCSLDPVKFTDTSLGQDIVNWAWDFGDGATSSEQYPTHIYKNADTYQVTLKVTKGNGATSALTKSVQITEAPTIKEQYEFWFCEGDETFTITVETPEEGITYKWYDYYGNSYLLAGSTVTLSASEGTLYLEKVAPNGCASKRAPVHLKSNPQPKAPVVQDAASYNGAAVLRLEAVDPDGRKDLTYHWYDVNYEYGGVPVHTGAVYEHHFSKTQELYIEAVSPAGCRSVTRTRATAYVHTKPLVIPDFKWAVTDEAPKGSYGYSIASDTDGNMLTFGEFSGSDSITSAGKTILPGEPLVQEWGSWKGRSNRYLFKYGPDGKAIDGFKILSQINEAGVYTQLTINTIETDEDNNIILTGYLQGEAHLITGKTPPAYGYVIMKLNPKGVLIWFRPIKVSGYGSMISHTVNTKVEKDGSFTCLLTMKGTAEVEGQYLGKTTYSYNYLWSRYVLRYSKDGALVSIREIAALDFYYNPTFPYNSGDYRLGPSEITVDEEENIYQLGAFVDLSFFSPIRMDAPSNDQQSVVLIKYSNQGQLIWHKFIAFNQFGSTSRKIVYHDNALYVTGISTVKNNVNTNFSDNYLNNASAFISKYDLDGNLLWVKPIEGKGGVSVQINNLLLDNAGNPYIIGTAKGPTSFDGLLVKNEEAADRQFSFIAMYNQDGTLGWARSIGNTTSDHTGIYSISGAFDKANQLTIHGTFYNALKLGGLELSSPDQSSMFTAKLGYTLKANMLVDGSCTGQPVTFQDKTTDTPSETVTEREWDFGDGNTSTAANPTHTYIKGGVYQVKLTSYGSLGSTSTAQYALQIKDAPAAVITVKDLQLTASEGESYRWFLNDSLLAETTPMIVAAKSGKYKVEVTVNGCSSISDIVDIQLSEPENEEEKEVTGFPNPTSDFLQIHSKEHPIAGYVIYDMRGNAIKSGKLPGELDITLDLRAYPPGLYFVHVQLLNGSVEVYKSLKQ